MKRKLIYPAIYKHFKGKNYAVIAVCSPFKNYNNFKMNNLFMNAEHTETGDIYHILKIENSLYYIKCNSLLKEYDEKLVLYKSLYDNHISYLRPLDMFLSKVDKEKYPESKQEYRFELIKNEKIYTEE